MPAYMDPAKTKYLTIHCAATPEGRDVKAATISQWDIQKFGQVSYHIVVELDGSYHRTLQDSQRGAHVGGHTSGNIGICYCGGAATDGKPPKDQSKNGRAPWRERVGQYGQIWVVAVPLKKNIEINKL